MGMTGSARVRAALLVTIAAVLALMLGACGSPAGTPAAAPGPVGTSTSTTAVGLPRSAPVSVRIPAIDAQSTLVALGLNSDGSVQLPPVSTPMQAGWFDGGPTPGEIGPAVILGHVDGDRQIGTFYRLHELVAGDQIMVTRKDGSTVTFAVTSVQKVSKTAFPTDQVYGNTGDPELRLITCGGSFNRAERSYVDNIIVYAKKL
jgi:LPXTG-site transpeptidase (sortase) family protein